MDVVTAALGYRARGFYCVPIPTGEKGPRIKGWQNLRLEETALHDAFTARTGNVGLVLGQPSGWLVDVDLDCEEAVRLAAQYLPATGAVTGRTGRERSHWWYICEDCETVRYRDPQLTNGAATTVELRSTGAQTVVGPSVHPDGSIYDVMSGEPARVPAGMLAACVEALHNAILKERGHYGQSAAVCEAETVAIGGADHYRSSNAATRPGDDYNERGDLHSLLLSHGWKVCGKDGNNIQLTRPGKTTGLSATWNGEHFYVFTSSCPQFEPDKGYRPFDVYARLEHNGDHSAAARFLGSNGYGSSGVAGDVDLSGILNGDRRIPATVASGDDPRAIQGETEGSQGMGGVSDETGILKPKSPVEFPPHLLKVPGFVGQVVQYSLATAHSPQPVLALWGALCLQATLCGRKICDPFGGRTNLYVMAMAGSGKGKNQPRVVNRRILAGAGLLELEGPEDLASDSGLLASVAHQPALLMQLDEVGRLLKSCASAGSQSSHLYNIATLLLRLYSSAGEIYKGKAYCDRSKNVEIDQPCLTIYGSTVPESFWGSMSSESIGDGFLARMIPVIGDENPPEQTARQIPVPESLLVHARGWGAYRRGGNLESVHPGPEVVEYTAGAEQILAEYRRNWRQRADSSGPWQPVWARAAEKACRLALVYVASKGTSSLRIDSEAIQWACEVSDYTTSLFESVGDEHIADSEFERKCQRVYQAVIGKKNGLAHRDLCRRRCWRALTPRERQEVLQSLIGDGRIDTVDSDRGGIVYVARG
jgi:hypothetical protein